MLVTPTSLTPIDFDGLRILDYTAGHDVSSSLAVIEVPPGVRHAEAWSRRSDKYYLVIAGAILFVLDGGRPGGEGDREAFREAERRHHLVVVNKSDLPAAATGEELGGGSGGVVRVSAKTGEGIDRLRTHLENSVSVLAGQSGVGKTSLINCLHPDIALETREVSDYNEKGRHTTTVSRLYHLAGGIDIIDTPGIRQLGVWDVTKEEVALYFPDIAALGEHCRFRDCSHTHEPGCAVQDAVETGALPAVRYKSYCRIRDSLDSKSPWA